MWCSILTLDVFELYRYIDTAEQLELEGVVDPNGREHLAQLLGHLYDLKVVRPQLLVTLTLCGRWWHT